MAGKEVYLKTVLDQTPRLLSQLDRNPFSKTYGCFDWLYWHDKITGFPNGHAQESMLVLALLYGINDKENPYWNKEKIRDWAIAALNYWARIQHKDGTVDEFYINERQLGATAITLYAAAKTFLLLKDHLKKNEAKQIRYAVGKSADILSKYDETHVLSNHQAQVVLSLHYAGEIRKKNYSGAIKKRIKKILKNQSKDGWFREYSGADLGYLSTTISFLAEYFIISRNEDLKEPLKRAIKFASYFLYPDGSYGGIIGSRNTAHLWTAGFETMNSIHPEEFAPVAGFCDAALESIDKGRLLTPEKEDRYFSEQMYDYLNAYLNYSRDVDSDTAMPFKGVDFRIMFNDSRIYISKLKGKYMTINAKKGGVIRIYDIAEKKCIFSDSGLIGRLTDGKVVISGHVDEKNEVNLSTDLLTIKGRFKYSSGQKQSTFKLSLFSIVMMIFARNVTISNFIKDKLILMLIAGKIYAPFSYIREIKFKSGLITDTISINEKKLKFITLSFADSLKDIFVAYSKYFDFSELETSYTDFDEVQLKQLNESGKIRIQRRVY